MPRNLLPEGMKRRGFRRGSAGSHRGSDNGEDDLSSASESRNMLSVPVDDYDNATDCEEFYDDDDGQKKSNRSFADKGIETNDECLTDIDDSSDEDNDSSTQPTVTRRSAKELSLYIQRVLGRPLRAVTCFRECEHGGTVIQTEHPDEDEVSDDESSCANESNFEQKNEHESSPSSQVSNIEASDLEDDLGIDLVQDDHRVKSVRDGNGIDSYLQGHFSRLSSTDHDARGRSDSEIDDEGHLRPGIVVSNYHGPSSDASHPVTEEEILSERELAHKPNAVRTKRIGRTRGQFSKQSNYLTASLPTLGQGETDSESESDGRQLIRSSFYQTSDSSNFRNVAEKNSPEPHGTLSNLPSTDSESFELEDEDENDILNSHSKASAINAVSSSENDSNSVKIVSQLSINDNISN